MKKILIINGSYHQGGIIEQSIEVMREKLDLFDCEVEMVTLRGYPIEFCLNCRACTQNEGSVPEKCVQNDGMNKLVEKMEAADGYILASPTNFGSVTAIFKRFMERLIVYGYWSWGMKSPQYRKEGLPKKKSILLSSCAAPSILGRLFFYSMKDLKEVSKTINAKVVGTLFIGLAANKSKQILDENDKEKIKRLIEKFLYSLDSRGM
ncbi:MAG: flavodoxin family protein [Epsilonproteobacteria bacterium]|nr:flavodoxin family protein [Campylobacterota bacterium]